MKSNQLCECGCGGFTDFPNAKSHLTEAQKATPNRFVRGHGQTKAGDPRIRFWKHVDATGDGCWNWKASKNNKGYGRYRVALAVEALAHRFSYELANGPIRDGLHVIHACDNPPCVNPAHLSVGTRSDNMQDMIAKGRRAPHPSSFKTHCAHGHPRTTESTYVAKDGTKCCRICKDESTRLSKLRRKLAA